MAAARAPWRAMQANLDPHKLVFIDEIWALTNMRPRYRRCEQGKRLSRTNPRDQWQTIGAPLLQIVDGKTWARGPRRQRERSD